jgi:hypothetical protein
VIPLALFALLFPEKLVDAVMAEIERMTNLLYRNPKQLRRSRIGLSDQ